MEFTNETRLADYVSSRNRSVQGWFGRIDAELFRLILTEQNKNNICGALAEIGVHHGKSFIALCLGMKPGEKAFCVDVFEEQRHNLDQSGEGNRQRLEVNLKKYGIEIEKISIRQKSSLDLRSDEILNDVGPVRFFSIDGGHWLEIVENDLKVAESCLTDQGVIALDDFHRPEWPDVSAGYFAWYLSRKKPLVPFAIGFNKLYLCTADYADMYQNIIENDRFLKVFLRKMVVFQGINVPVFSEYMLPEFGIFKRMGHYLRTFHPEAGHWLLRTKESVRTLLLSAKK